MQRRSRFLLALSLLMLSTMAYAQGATNKSLTSPAYFNASCPAITGTWEGFFTDPTDLYGDGGAAPIRMSFYQQSGHVIGRIDPSLNPNNPISAFSTKIWAGCNNGMLQHVFLGEQGHCGSFSKGGELVSKNILILYLNRESAMTGTQFLVVLHRVNNAFNYPIEQSQKDLILGPIQSCH